MHIDLSLSGAEAELVITLPTAYFKLATEVIHGMNLALSQHCPYSDSVALAFYDIMPLITQSVIGYRYRKKLAV